MIPHYSDFERCKHCSERIYPNGGCKKYPADTRKDVTPAVKQCEKDHPEYGKWEMFVSWLCPFCKSMTNQREPPFCPFCGARLDSD